MSSWKDKKCYFKAFSKWIGEDDTLLAKIQYIDLETYKNHLKATPTPKGTQRKLASINRQMTTLHHLLKKGKEWKFLEAFI